MMAIDNLAPFIKWVGGKRQLLPELLKLMPKNFNRYYEPFLGGGAMLLALQPDDAVVNDYNGQLVNAWQMVQNHLDDLVVKLKEFQLNDSKDFYYQIRKIDRSDEIKNWSNIDLAARFIYLNKAGFNGLWRVNKKNQNNVPYANPKKLNLVSKSLLNDGQYLLDRHIKILKGDYRDALMDVQSNDLVYFDPPYIPVSITSSFTSYTDTGFDLKDQKALSDLAKDLVDQGVHVVLSNNDVPLIQQLYPSSHFEIHHVLAKRMINSNASKRGKVGEVIIVGKI